MPEQQTDRVLRAGAWAACLFVIAVFVAVGVVEALDTVVVRDWTDTQVGGTVEVLTVFAFPVVGLLVVRQQPRNVVGWLLITSGLMWAVIGFQELYGRLAIDLWPGRLPAGGAVVAVGASFWWPAVVTIMVFTVLFFPDGRLPSPRWRWVAWTSLAACVLGTLILIVSPGPVGDTVVISHNPLGLPIGTIAAQVLQLSVIWTLPVSMLAAASSLVLRFRRSSGVERLQLKWLMTAVVFTATAFALSLTLAVLGVGGGHSVFLQALEAAAVLSFGLVPVTIGIAITRHGLYGIDKLISRALVVGVLGLFITAVYVGVVVGIGALVGGQGHPSVALSVLATAVVAVAFQPVREAVSGAVNRLVYGTRATPYEVVSEFAASMTGTYTTAELLPRIAQTVAECLGGARVEVWLLSGHLLERGAVWPRGEDAAGQVAVGAPDELGGLRGARVVPVRHRDELLGAITVSKPATEPVTPPEDEMLVHVASQTGLVLRNLRLVDDLHSSRQRLVTSQDDQRRRLERDLHDGAQQSLVAVALTLRMATRSDDPRTLSSSATQAADQLQAAIAELRELARGLHPAVLTERGLGPALVGLVERCPVPVHLVDDVTRRLPAAVEGALYFVAAESLTNIAKYAQASEVTLRVADLGDTVTLEVADDGVGGADASRGSGLLGLSDRMAVVDGTLSVHSPPGDGTRIRCTVQVPVLVPDQRPAGEPLTTMARSSS